MDIIKPQIRQVKENEVLLRDKAEWLHFTNPHRVFRIENLNDLLPAMYEIEQLVENNHWHAAGFLSYEAASAFESASPPHSESGFPYLWFGLYPKPQQVVFLKPQEPKETLDWHPTICRKNYQTAISQIKDHIAMGRTYQVNFTMRLQTEFTGSAWEFFLYLAQTQNQHAAYIDIGRYVICSASPELFFELDGNSITCRPMKGTAARGRNTVEDIEQSHWLQNSVKNRAENVMIVDMVRNDLGRIAEIGSVAVPRLFDTERYPTLWQMTSTVTARTKASIAEIFAALFPSASITGAPKVSTMKIIADLETTPRKVYTGAIGFMAPQRKAKFNVAIRTALIDREQKHAEYGIGGGVVWDSSSGDEYAEALLKAKLLTEQTRPFSLFETMLWTPEEGYFLREEHVERLLDSALYFDISVTKKALEEYLSEISFQFHTPQRVRVLLDQSGNLDFQAKPFPLLSERQPLKVGLAKEPIDSKNIFLFHKTTNRNAYESAQKGFEHLDDVLLYNEKREVTEFTIGNLVAELGGQLVTPPVACGVLAGTFRAHLLESRQIAEKIISVEELPYFTKIFRINSIRRWQVAEIEN